MKNIVIFERVKFVAYRIRKKGRKIALCHTMNNLAFILLLSILLSAAVVMVLDGVKYMRKLLSRKKSCIYL